MLPSIMSRFSMSVSMSTSLDYLALLFCFLVVGMKNLQKPIPELTQSQKQSEYSSKFGKYESSRNCVLPESVTTIYTLRGMTLTFLIVNKSTFSTYTSTPNSKFTRGTYIKRVEEFERFRVRTSQTYLRTSITWLYKISTLQSLNLQFSKSFTLKSLNVQFLNRHVLAHAAWRWLTLIRLHISMLLKIAPRLPKSAIWLTSVPLVAIDIGTQTTDKKISINN